MTSRFGEDKDKYYMNEALAQAQTAFDHDEVPIGAVVVDANGEILASGYNQVEHDHAQSSHAEVLAINEAGKKRGDWRLSGCWLYVTLEPCLMCIGLIRLSRLEGIVFATKSPLFGYRLDKNVTYQLYKDDTIKIVEGVREKEASDMLQKFFKLKREKSG